MVQVVHIDNKIIEGHMEYLHVMEYFLIMKVPSEEKYL